MCAARVQAIVTPGAPADQVGRGESPVWQLEEELGHAARGIGQKRESMLHFQSEEASSRLLGLRAAPRRATSAAGVLLRPPAKRRARSRSSGLLERMRWSSGRHGTLKPAGGLFSVDLSGVCVRLGVSRWPVYACCMFLGGQSVAERV